MNLPASLVPIYDLYFENGAAPGAMFSRVPCPFNSKPSRINRIITTPNVCLSVLLQISPCVCILHGIVCTLIRRTRKNEWMEGRCSFPDLFTDECSSSLLRWIQQCAHFILSALLPPLQMIIHHRHHYHHRHFLFARIYTKAVGRNLSLNRTPSPIRILLMNRKQNCKDFCFILISKISFRLLFSSSSLCPVLLFWSKRRVLSVSGCEYI